MPKLEEKITINTNEPKAPPQKSAEPKAKKPSRLFTHYYGSVILLLIAALVAAGFFIIKPKIEAYKEIRSQTIEVNNKINAEKQYHDGLSRSVAAANTIDPSVLEKVDQALPRSLDIPKILVQIDQAARANGAEVASIAFAQTEAKKDAQGIQPVGLNMSVKAKNYQALKNFLDSLETSLRIMDLQMLSVAQFSDAGTSFTLQMQTYYFPAKSN